MPHVPNSDSEVTDPELEDKTARQRLWDAAMNAMVLGEYAKSSDLFARVAGYPPLRLYALLFIARNAVSALDIGWFGDALFASLKLMDGDETLSDDDRAYIHAYFHDLREGCVRDGAVMRVRDKMDGREAAEMLVIIDEGLPARADYDADKVRPYMQEHIKIPDHWATVSRKEAMDQPQEFTEISGAEALGAFGALAGLFIKLS